MVSGTTAGTLSVLGSGVSVFLSPASAAPGSPFQLRVQNTGTRTDTFDLTLAGPAALVGSLGMNKVTLAPFGVQMVPITTTAVTFAEPGALNLTAMATSEAEPAVQAGASAALTIPTTTGLTAQFSPAAQA